LYIDAFGLTMLRLACVAAAVWMMSLLVLIAASTLGFKHERRWLPAAIVISFTVTTLAFSAINPEALVVRYNVHRAGDTPVDIRYLASLSDDAVPELVASLGSMTSPEAAHLEASLCQRPQRSSGWAGWNLGTARATDRLASLCSTPTTTSLVILPSPSSAPGANATSVAGK
jgi:hypothetical protein